ncbi:MAG: DUF1778 domain-containing protein [Thiothrix litoralis]
MMSATHLDPKTERVVSRVSPEVKALLAQAASWAGFSSINQFIVQSALREAERIVQHEQVIRLSLRDTRAFLHALEQPPNANAALLRAAKHYKASVTTE